jgi:hypothetical protein
MRPLLHWGVTRKPLGYERIAVRTRVFVTPVAVQLAPAFSTRSRLTGHWREGLGRDRLLPHGVLAALGLQVAVVYTPLGRPCSTPRPRRRWPGPWSPAWPSCGWWR